MVYIYLFSLSSLFLNNIVKIYLHKITLFYDFALNLPFIFLHFCVIFLLFIYAKDLIYSKIYFTSHLLISDSNTLLRTVSHLSYQPSFTMWFIAERTDHLTASVFFAIHPSMTCADGHLMQQMFPILYRCIPVCISFRRPTKVERDRQVLSLGET